LRGRSRSPAADSRIRRRGGNVSLHPMGSVDRSDSAALSYAPALGWFERLGARP